MTTVTFTLPEEFLPTLTQAKLAMEQDMALGNVSERTAAKAEVIRQLQIGENTLDVEMAEKFAAALGMSTRMAQFIADQHGADVSDQIKLNMEIVFEIAKACWAAYDHDQKVQLVAATVVALPLPMIMETFTSRYGATQEEITGLLTEALAYLEERRAQAEAEEQLLAQYDKEIFGE